jgi:hypothetical protein
MTRELAHHKILVACEAGFQPEWSEAKSAKKGLKQVLF